MDGPWSTSHCHQLLVVAGPILGYKKSACADLIFGVIREVAVLSCKIYRGAKHHWAKHGIAETIELYSRVLSGDY